MSPIAELTSARRALWTDRNFSVFWAGQTLAALGNSFGLVAMPLLVLQTTGSVAQMGLLTGVAGVTAIVTGLFAGALVDRLDRRRLMIVCEVARLAVIGSIPLAWLAGPQVWLLYVGMAVAAAFDMIFKVGYVAAVPALVGPERIIEANGRLETTNAVAYIGGPMLAGLVSGLLGPALAVGVNAATFGLSAVALALIRLRPTTVDAAGRPGLRESFVAGFRFLWQTPVLRAITVLLVMVSFLSIGMVDVFIYDVHTVLGGGDHATGIVIGIAGIGTVLAAVALPTLRRSWGFGVCWIGSYVLCAVAITALALSTSITPVAIAVLCYTFAMTLAGVSSMSLRQAVTPDHLLGRVTSAFWTVHGALGPLGAAVLTGLVATFGVRGPLLGVGAAFLVVALIALATPIRKRRPEADVQGPPPQESIT